MGGVLVMSTGVVSLEVLGITDFRGQDVGVRNGVG